MHNLVKQFNLILSVPFISFTFFLTDKNSNLTILHYFVQEIYANFGLIPDNETDHHHHKQTKHLVPA